MNKDRTTTTIPAHSLKKGDVVILFGKELLVKEHPIHTVSKAFGAVVKAQLVFLDSIVKNAAGNIVQETHRGAEWGQNDSVEILVGGNSGGSF